MWDLQFPPFQSRSIMKIWSNEVILRIQLAPWIRVKAIRRLNRRPRKGSITLESPGLHSITLQCSYRSSKSRLSKKNCKSSWWGYTARAQSAMRQILLSTRKMRWNECPHLRGKKTLLPRYLSSLTRQHELALVSCLLKIRSFSARLASTLQTRWMKIPKSNSNITLLS